MVNNKIDDFKLFVKANPFLITYIRDGKKTWQELYELYDICGDDEGSWNKYLEDVSSSDNNNQDTSGSGISGHFDELVKMAKKVDVDKVQEGITSLQKTLTLFGDLFVNKESSGKGYSPRPLYRRFED
jgi:hypothetical protein